MNAIDSQPGGFSSTQYQLMQQRYSKQAITAVAILLLVFCLGLFIGTLEPLMFAVGISLKLKRTAVTTLCHDVQRTGSKQPRIAILTLAILQQKDPVSAVELSLSWASLMNKQQYSQVHGYDFIPVLWSQHQNVHPVWNKLPAILQHLKDYDWIWALDVDAFITNMDLSIEDHILAKVQSKNVSMIVAEDCNGLNAGSFFLRRTAWSIALLEHAWALRNKNRLQVPELPWWKEQAAIIKVVSQMDAASVQQHIAYLSPQDMNTYPDKCGSKYKPGTFVLHVAHMSWEKKLQCVQELAPHVLIDTNMNLTKQT